MAWKTGLQRSILLFVVMMAIGAGQLWYIADHPRGDVLDDLRAEWAGKFVGMILGVGLGIIWMQLLFAHLHRKNDPMLSE
jgi:hypothetical protein